MEINQTHKQRYVYISGKEIAVTEDVYFAYMRPLWVEHKHHERESRCRTENGSRCKKDCRQCDRTRTGRPLSLEQFRADGFEIPDYTDPLDLLIKAELREAVFAALEELDAEDLQIIKMLVFENLSERQVALQIGLSQKGINKRKHKILKQLRKYLEDF